MTVQGFNHIQAVCCASRIMLLFFWNVSACTAKQWRHPSASEHNLPREQLQLLTSYYKRPTSYVLGMMENDDSLNVRARCIFMIKYSVDELLHLS